MVSKKQLKGIITPLITPYRNRKLDYKALNALSDFIVKSKVSAAFPAGSTGCFPFLRVKEHIGLINAFAESLGDRIMLIPGVGRNSVSETEEVARAVSKLDPYAVVVTTPYYIHLNNESLFRYFDVIASSVSENIILYNIPQFTGNPISVELVLALLQKHKNIIGIKDSSGDFRSFVGFIRNMPKDFLVLQGQDDLLLSSLMLGAQGGVCGTTNFSDLAVRVYKAYKTHNISKAIKLQKDLRKLMKAVNAVQFPTGYNFMFYKEVLGKNETNAVKPISNIKREEQKRLYKAVKKLINV